MRRGAKPAKAKVEAKIPVAKKPLKTESSRVRDLENRLAEALKREAEAREQQTAGVIGEFTLPLVRGTVTGRAVLDARTVHIADLQVETEEFPEGSQSARRLGHRTVLCVPLMREGIGIGTINLRRTEARLFSERQVA